MANINTKADTELKKQAVRENRISLEISRDVPNKETTKAMQDILNNRNMSPVFTNMEDLFNSLNA